MVKKITIYTISSCPFSQQEKEYLKANNLSFEEKNLEQNREWLTEMLTIANNFAGTPVTKIEDENGQITVLKGFTKEEFDKILGITPAKPEPDLSSLNAQMPVPPQNPASSSPPPPPPPPSSQSQPPASSSSQSQDQPQSPSPVSSVANNNLNQSPSVNQQQPSQPQDPALQSVLDNLQQKAESSASSVSQQPTSQSVVDQPSTSQSSSSPDPNLPKIPDFPQ